MLTYIDTSRKKLIALVGPTCTGKTDTAIALAQALNAEIINADSRLIFKEMNIGTAKPFPDELAMIKHHLVDIRSITENYSAGDYQKDFDLVVSEIWKRDPEKKIIVVGGTGLYLRAALENLELPEFSMDEALRQELNEKPLPELLNMLSILDPEALNLLDIQNKVRVIRALELVSISGKPLAELRSKSSEPRYETVYLGLDFEKRRELYDLINLRVIKMIRRGLVHEVEGLINKYGRVRTIDSTIGYREIADYLNGEIDSLNEARRRIQLRTRRYAKKQMTWFRSNRDIKWFYR